jgi:hypothetical protein
MTLMHDRSFFQKPLAIDSRIVSQPEGTRKQAPGELRMSKHGSSFGNSLLKPTLSRALGSSPPTRREIRALVR